MSEALYDVPFDVFVAGGALHSELGVVVVRTVVLAFLDEETHFAQWTVAYYNFGQLFCFAGLGEDLGKRKTVTHVESGKKPLHGRMLRMTNY